MKATIKDFILLVTVWALTAFIVASCGKSAYAVDLSKNTSVTPQRHCGFIVPKFCIGSQSMHEIKNASITAMHTRLQSLYEGMTRQNKPMVNMSGGTCIPRVNPLTSFKHGEISQNSKISGGNHHA